MNATVPTIPKRMRVTATMLDDFLGDPVLAARVFMGLELDAFQAVRLRYHWWTPNLIDSSGYSSGKTIVDFAYVCLRCILLTPAHTAAVYYPSFETGKNAFWDMNFPIAMKAPLFRAHMGRTDDDGDKSGSDRTRGQSSWKAYFKPDAMLILPAPSWEKEAATQAGNRFNTILIDEWTHIEAKTGTNRTGGITGQIIGRASKTSFNPNHPVWGTHIHFSATAKPRSHVAYGRFRTYEREHKKGNPSYHVFSFSYKDFSGMPGPDGRSFRESYRNDGNIAKVKLEHLSKGLTAEWLGEGLGIWAIGGTGWYTGDSIQRCRMSGSSSQLTPSESAAMNPWGFKSQESHSI